ncbi:iron complex transport system substrate-binding protein [Parvibaculum indicum]|uniref:heme/hemin ABC transporter substrate-binding protein n=1 Tax=Parvibaculum indicum TaxID=562969 RepID=UPI00141FFDC0|nr:ABC transporter substrate-binding protein [Parvibaculum indicum]NIJ42552.1 iron complex transport system substrate-binding protein [Parvibaculum indicum]
MRAGRLSFDARLAGTAILTAVLASLLAFQAARAAEPERILSLGGAVTETVAALGAADKLVAVDLTSKPLPAGKDLPSVGYYRQLSAEPIIAMTPDLILAADGAGPDTALEQIRSTGVKVVHVPETHSAEGVVDKVRVVAGALGREERGDELIGKMEADFGQLDKALEGIDRPRVMLLLSAGRGAPMAAGRETAGDAIVAMSGGENVMTTYTGYKPVSPEAVVQAAPDFIILPSHVAEAMGGAEGLVSMPGFAETPAVKNGHVLTMDSLLLLGFGPRTPEAAAKLAALLHPDRDIPELSPLMEH